MNMRFEMLVILVPLLFMLGALILNHSTQLDRHIKSIIAALGVFLINALIILAAVIAIDFPPATAMIFAAAPVNLIMLNLIIFMAIVLLSYSRNYMAGEACYQRFFVWMLLTFAAVSFTVVSNHLLLTWLGWLAISLCLHRLLTLYPERPRAILAAHKKFILARAAELFLGLGFILLYNHYNTPYISVISDAVLNLQISDSIALSWQEQIAALCIAIAALIKCAQLPVHGWLIKVVEVPTPVSALLHAGVINLGGFVIILFAPLLSFASLAQWLLLIVAGVSTLLAALIMTTRISVKVRLAWSTSAQMGMMLVQCALGLYQLALLHLVLHSAYKAHAFLSAGNAVHDFNTIQIGQRLKPGVWGNLYSGLWVTVCIVVAMHFSAGEGPISIWLLLGLSLFTYMYTSAHSGSTAVYLKCSVMVAVFALAYAGLKIGFGHALGLHESVVHNAFSTADLWVSAIVVALFTIAYLLKRHAHQPRIQRLSTQLFAGLYLDEWFTRTTLKIGSAKLPRTNLTDQPAYPHIKMEN